MAIAPLFVLWFGIGLLPKVLVVILVTFFPIAVALLDGLAATDRDATDLLESMGATRRQQLLKLRLPGALPYLFTGLRIAVTYAVIGAIFGEAVGAVDGLGIWIVLSKNLFRTDLVFAAILITATADPGPVAARRRSPSGWSSRGTERRAEPRRSRRPAGVSRS